MRIKLALVAFLCFCCYLIKSQEIHLEPEISFVDEALGTAQIIIKLNYNASIDSIAYLSIEDSLYRPLSRSNSTSYVNGEMSQSTTFTYRFRPSRSGSFKIECPSYFCEGKRYEKSEIKFEVEDLLEESEMTEDQKRKYLNKRPISILRWRISYSENGGFLEERVNGEWQFKRLLSKEENQELLKNIQLDED